MVYLFLADGFEEVEALSVVDMLRRADIELKTVSITKDNAVTGSHGIITLADAVIKKINFDEASMIILPGGKRGTDNLEKCELLMNNVRKFIEEGKKVSAICAAPTILGRAGLLNQRKACCYPGLEKDLLGANVSFDKVCTDDNLITSRGAGTSLDFAFAIITSLKNSETAKRVSDSIVYG